MSYYASEEIYDLEKENLKLKQKLGAIRTVIVDLFDKDTKADDIDLCLDTLIKIESIIKEC